MGAKPIIYLDNAASTPIFPEIIESFPHIHATYFANPSAAHGPAYQCREKIQESSTQVLESAGIPPSSATVLWTSGATEANNLAILGVMAYAPRHAEIVSTNAEHASIHGVLDHLANHTPYKVTLSPVKPDGRLNPERFREPLTQNTRLVSVTHVQSETGVIQCLETLRQSMDQMSPHALLHVDAVQGYGRIDIPWQSAKIDLLTISSHKIHGPAGIGALICRRGTHNLHPIMFGGGQQQNIRPGTLDTCGIIGFAMAARQLVAMKSGLRNLATELNAELRQSLTSLTDKLGRPVAVTIHSPAAGSPFVLNFSLSGFEGAILARMLSDRDIVVGTGSACSSESKKPSRTLTAMGIAPQEAYGSLRVSFGFQNTLHDVMQFVIALRRVIEQY